MGSRQQSVELDMSERVNPISTELPPAFVPTWLWILAQPHLKCTRYLDVVELFCGKAELSKACREKGFETRSLDRENSPQEDLGNMTGLQGTIQLIMSMKIGALLWLAPPCKNWVFLSTPQHKRNRSNFFLGACPDRATKEANSLVYTVAALIRLAVSRGVHYIIEQPTDSRMLQTACMSKALKMTRAQTIVTYLAAFCEDFPCCKGLHLCGSAPILRSLRRNPPPSQPCNRVYVKDVFSGAVSGGPDLEETQHYPQEFGVAVNASVTSIFRHDSFKVSFFVIAKCNLPS